MSIGAGGKWLLYAWEPPLDIRKKTAELTPAMRVQVLGALDLSPLRAVPALERFHPSTPKN